jgi:cellulose synthase/poly-beta-1,6-N-acetylglucosamine synthase-like glycosyltransferase
MKVGAARGVQRLILTIGVVGSVAAAAHSLVNLRRLRTPADNPAPSDRSISVLIPARNEAAAIGTCLAAVRLQVGTPKIEILVYDDRSVDGTDQVVRHHTSGDDRVLLISGSDEPPSGWLGKTWACHQLALRATGEVLVFLDADVVLERHAIAASVELLGTSSDGLRIDAVCPYPRQLAVTASERLIQPLLQWSWLTFLPLGVAEWSSRESLTAANGQLLVIERSAYDAVGGHAAIRHEVLDDIAIFRSLKRAARRGVVADGTHLASCRMYDRWPELRDGYQKSLWSAFGSPAAAIAVVACMGVLFVVPAAAMLRGSKLGAIGYAAGVAGRAAVAQRSRSRIFPDVLAHPASVALFGYLTVGSLRRKSQGQLTWKGRKV